MKIENSKIWVWTLEISFYIFKKIEQDWEVFCLINCCREISYIVKVKIHVKWGQIGVKIEFFDLGYGCMKNWILLINYRDL